MNEPLRESLLRQTRRHFLGAGLKGLGTAALASLLSPYARGAGAEPAGEEHWRGVVDPLHHVPKAKRVIQLYMAGGPSHYETFDYKPKLEELDGQDMPKSFTEGQPIAQLQGEALRCFGPQHPFKRWGRSGQEIATIFPHIGGVADDLCIIRSMHTDQINHDPAHLFMNTGTLIPGRPSMGSWVLYGLGAETDNLPGFVVLTSEGGGQAQPISSRQWSSGLLPGRFQGVQLRSTGNPVLYTENPPGVSAECQSEVVRVVGKLNETLNAAVDDPDIATRIAQYELAFRMQMSVPELADYTQEPDYIKELYGTQGGDGTFASNCLLARRLAERGVRFIQVYHRGWDHHGQVKRGTETTAKLVDQASAALITDLKQRGMLDDTLVIWSGEFGRTPMQQGNGGRDHHIRGFSLFMTGGGVRPGMTFGATDELGYHAVEHPIHVHDFHATMLHLLGVDHKRLTYRFQGRDFRLTDVFGNVVRKILL